MEPPNNPFSKIKGRYLVIIWIFPFSYLLGFLDILERLSQQWPWYGLSIFCSYYFHAIFIITIIAITIYGKFNWDIFFKHRVTFNDFVPVLKLVGFFFFFSTALSYIIFYPLSFVCPGFVETWYLKTYEVIYFDGQSYPIIANILSFLSIVFIAPVLEEIAFRGILLHRWSYKWNQTKAILFSSIIFGIFHPEPIGAIVFGMCMCVLYIKTQSLLVTIICHSLNNLIAWCIVAGYKLFNGPTYEFNLIDFQNEWYIGVICTIISIGWIGMYLQNPVDINEDRLP